MSPRPPPCVLVPVSWSLPPGVLVSVLLLLSPLRSCTFSLPHPDLSSSPVSPLSPQLGEDALVFAGGVLVGLVGDVGWSRPHRPAGSSLQRPSVLQLVERGADVPDR